ncbi:hypothetical protein [Deinococcus radiophilus]|uniref:hypothetical protein n=1 Tax=Deinococcus radiophilus TaxID=32062 RepID=UPI00360AFD0B
MTTYHSPTDPSQALKQVQNWLEQYGGTEVDVAELLCDRWAREPGRKALNYENGFGYHEASAIGIWRKDRGGSQRPSVRWAWDRATG